MRWNAILVLLPLMLLFLLGVAGMVKMFLLPETTWLKVLLGLSLPGWLLLWGECFKKAYRLTMPDKRI